MEPRAVTVDPGGTAQVQITVRNTGTAVDVLRLDVLGDSAGWAAVQPREINLFPGQDGVAVVHFEPPRDPSIRAGARAFGVKATPTQAPNASAVEEGTVDVLPFADLFAELVPRTIRGRRRARADLAVDNRGNVGMNIEAEGADQDGALKVVVREPGLHGEPGSAVFSPVDVRPVKAHWRGPSRTLPFQVQVVDSTSGQLLVDGTMVQDAIVPKWFAKALAGALMALVALAVLWWTVLRPVVETTAQEAAAEEVAAQVNQIKREADERAKAGAPVAAAEEAGREAGKEAAEQAINDAIEEGVVIAQGDPIDFRLAIDTGSDSQATRSFDGKVFSLTDVVLQNPREDSGTLSIQRGSTTLLEVGLDNFRDLDYHYVTPVVFDEEDVVVVVVCDNDEQRPCTPSVSFTGFEKDKE